MGTRFELRLHRLFISVAQTYNDFDLFFTLILLLRSYAIKRKNTLAQHIFPGQQKCYSQDLKIQIKAVYLFFNSKTEEFSSRRRTALQFAFTKVCWYSRASFLSQHNPLVPHPRKERNPGQDDFLSALNLNASFCKTSF